MRIGEIAATAGVNIQTLRYYERRGLLPKPRRRGSGYREYDPETVQLVRFIKRAQELGFTLTEAAELIQLRQSDGGHTTKVRALATAKLEDIEAARASCSSRGSTSHRRPEFWSRVPRSQWEPRPGTSGWNGGSQAVNKPINKPVEGRLEMATKRTVEVFSAGCAVCDDAVQAVQKIACESCDVQVQDMRTDAAKTKAKQYGIKRVPAVVVNGRLAECCQQGAVDVGTLQRLGIGQS